MPFDIAGAVGNASGWLEGNASPSTPVTDLSPHVDGGPNSAQPHSNQNSDKAVLHIAVIYVLTALALLWFMGVVVIRTARL